MKLYLVKHSMIGARAGLIKGTLIDEQALKDRGCDIDHLLANQAIEEVKPEAEASASTPSETVDGEKPATEEANQTQEKEPKTK